MTDISRDRTTRPGQPKFAVSACTTYHTTFDEDIDNYRVVGISGIGLWEYKLPVGEDERSAERLLSSGLTATFCFPMTPGIVAGEHLFASPIDPKQRLQLLSSSIRRFARYQPVAVGCLAGAPRDTEPARLRRDVVIALREAAYVAGEVGVRLALEVVRPSTGGSLVATIPDALDMIAEIGTGNIDVLLDSWHVSELTDIATDVAENIDHIAGVQLSDRAANSKGWYDRAMPGTGELPIVKLIQAVIEAGFDGWYELEIFSDDGTFGTHYAHSFWERPPRDVLRAGKKSFEGVWSRAAGGRT